MEIGKTTVSAFGQNSYIVRPGAIEYGREYEYLMTTLMALRCISSDVEEAGIAFNPDGCSDFDDMVIYRKLKGKDDGIISLVQLKHQDRARDIQLDDFLRDRGNFSLKKYEKALGEVQKGNFQILKSMFQDNNVNLNSIQLILYTNRDAYVSGTIPNYKACEFLKCYDVNHFMKTNNENSKIYAFDMHNEHLQSYSKEFFERLLCFVKQVDVKLINQLIWKEFENISDIDKNVIDKFVQFITQWAKGELGGHYVLTKTRIIQELLGLLLDPYILKFVQSSEKVVNVNNDNFNEVIRNFDITLISNSDSTVMYYLRSWVNQFFIFKEISLQMSCKLDEDHFNELCSHFPGLNCQISIISIKTGTVKIYDAYKALFRLGSLQGILIIDSNKDYLHMTHILSYLKYNLQFIVLSQVENSSEMIFDSFRVLNSLNDLDKKSVTQILDREVKFQGRGPVKLRSIVENVPNFQELISTKDIIHILNGTFSIGDSLPSLPEIYIPRSLSKIILSFDVFDIFRECIMSVSNHLLFNSVDEIHSEKNILVGKKIRA